MSRLNSFRQGSDDQPTPIDEILARNASRPVVPADPNVPVMNAEPAGPVSRRRRMRDELATAGITPEMTLAEAVAQETGQNWQGQINAAMNPQNVTRPARHPEAPLGGSRFEAMLAGAMQPHGGSVSVSGALPQSELAGRGLPTNGAETSEWETAPGSQQNNPFAPSAPLPVGPQPTAHEGSPTQEEMGPPSQPRYQPLPTGARISGRGAPSQPGYQPLPTGDLITSRRAPRPPEYRPLPSGALISGEEMSEQQRRVLENQEIFSGMQPPPEQMEWREGIDTTSFGDIVRGLGSETAQAYVRMGKNLAHTVAHPEDTIQLAIHPSRWDEVAEEQWKNIKENPLDFAFDLAAGGILTAGAGAVGVGVGRATTSGLRITGKADDAIVAANNSVDAPDVTPNVNAPEANASAPNVGNTPTGPRYALPESDAPRPDAPRTPVRAPTARDFPDAQKLSRIERLDTRLAAGVERRLQRRSDWQPTNIARRALGMETRDLRYSRLDRGITNLADRIGGDSSSLPRQYLRARLTRSQGAPEFPEGTAKWFDEYETARWRNQQLMRNPNRVRALSGAWDDIQKIAAFDPMTWLMRADQEAGLPEEEGMVRPRQKPKLPTEPYLAGRGFRHRPRITIEGAEEDIGVEEADVSKVAKAAIGTGEMFGADRDMLRARP